MKSTWANGGFVRSLTPQAGAPSQWIASRGFPKRPLRIVANCGSSMSWVIAQPILPPMAEWHKVKVQILSSTAEHPLTPAYKKGYYARTK